ncbi:MAG: hypothetical protein V1824_02140 [archaeon]
MQIEFLQIIIIAIIIIVFGSLITFINLRKKIMVPINKEQNSWQKIDLLNSKKNEFIKKKEELSFKYSAKAITDDAYYNGVKYINDELKKIDDEINLEVSKLTKIQETDEGQGDLRLTNIKLKGDLKELDIENNNLKQKIIDLENFIKNISNTTVSNSSVSTNNSKEKYYELIIDKYKDLINDLEKKTISEIKDMIRVDDLTIKNIIAKYRPIGYDFSKDYLETLHKIYNKLLEIDVVKTDIKVLFWIDISKIIKNNISDEQDISILLCSIMQSLGDSNATVNVVLLENNDTHAFVKTKYKNYFYIFDLAQKLPMETLKNTDEDKLIKEYKFKDSKISKEIYKYNQYIYESLEE